MPQSGIKLWPSSRAGACAICTCAPAWQCSTHATGASAITSAKTGATSRHFNQVTIRLQSILTALIMSPQDPSLWIILGIIGLLTFAIRLSFIEWLGAKKIPAVFTHTLRFVPLAVLTAIIFPEIFMRNGEMAVNLANTRMIAGIVAGLVALRSKNVLLTIAVGMGMFWILQVVTHAAN